MFQRRFNRKTAAARLSSRNTKLISEEIYLAADTVSHYGSPPEKTADPGSASRP